MSRWGKPEHDDIPKDAKRVGANASPVRVTVNRGGEITRVTRSGTEVFGAGGPSYGVIIEVYFEDGAGESIARCFKFHKGATYEWEVRQPFECARDRGIWHDNMPSPPMPNRDKIGEASTLITMATDMDRPEAERRECAWQAVQVIAKHRIQVGIAAGSHGGEAKTTSRKKTERKSVGGEDWVLMTSRFDNKCRECGVVCEEGSEVAWCPEQKRIECMTCWRARAVNDSVET